MPDIKIVKIKLRRGPEVQRKLVTLDQGELGYVTDSKRVFVGDGSTVGGTVVGSRIFTPTAGSITSLAAYAGDVAIKDNLMYQLTGTNAVQTSAWRLTSPLVDNSTLELTPTTNVIRIKNDGVGINQLGNITYALGGIIINNTQGLSANVDKNTICINASNQLAVSSVYASSIVGTINNSQIDATTMAGNALSGSTNGKLNVKVDNSTIIISSDQLSVGSLDASVITSGTFGSNRISSAALGSGLQGGNGTQLSINYNSNSLDIDGASALRLKSLYNATRLPLSANGATFGGFYGLTAYGTTQYQVTTATPAGEVSAGAQTFSLSSAGFVVIDFGADVGKMAVPIFKVPDELQNLTIADISV